MEIKGRLRRERRHLGSSSLARDNFGCCWHNRRVSSRCLVTLWNTPILCLAVPDAVYRKARLWHRDGYAARLHTRIDWRTARLPSVWATRNASAGRPDEPNRPVENNGQRMLHCQASLANASSSETNCTTYKSMLKANTPCLRASLLWGRRAHQEHNLASTCTGFHRSRKHSLLGLGSCRMRGLLSNRTNVARIFPD